MQISFPAVVGAEAAPKASKTQKHSAAEEDFATVVSVLKGADTADQYAAPAAPRPESRVEECRKTDEDCSSEVMSSEDDAGPPELKIENLVLLQAATEQMGEAITVLVVPPVGLEGTVLRGTSHTPADDVAELVRQQPSQRMPFKPSDSLNAKTDGASATISLVLLAQQARVRRSRQRGGTPPLSKRSFRRRWYHEGERS